MKIYHFYDPSYYECRDEKDLCGGTSSVFSDDDDYTFREGEVTCERCLAALQWLPRSRAELDAYVRLALKIERERIKKLIGEEA